MVDTHQFIDGLTIVAAGMAVVFAGLALIWLAISLFNWFARARISPTRAASLEAGTPPSSTNAGVPREHLLAIGAAVELYRRLHLELPESAVTFERGDERTGWKLGVRYGQRQHPVR